MYLFEKHRPRKITEQDKILFGRLLNAPIRRLLEQRADGLYLVQDFYPNGVKRTDPFLVCDKNHTSYYELTASEHHYEELSIVGSLIVWYENGQKLLECSYQDFKLQGTYKKWYLNGILAKKEIYKNGKLHGRREHFYEGGILQLEDNWSLGKMQGDFKKWHTNGQLAKEEFFVNNKNEGEVIAYFRNGQISNKAFYKENALEGIVKEWFQNGQLKSEKDYKEGVLDGFSTEYYENGQLRFKIQYERGRENGLCIMYHRNGELFKNKKNYNWGKYELMGDIRELTKKIYNRVLLKVVNENLYLVQDFYESGEKATDPYYLIDKEEAYKKVLKQVNYAFSKIIVGIIKVYYTNGFKYFLGNYEDGKKEGRWDHWIYSEQSNTIEETKYYHKDILKKCVKWHKNGNKKTEILYEDNKELSKIDYDENGCYEDSYLMELFKKSNASSICRKLVDITKDNYYLVQDFYFSGEKVTDPYLIKNINEVSTIRDYTKLTSVIGPFTIWYTSIATNLELQGVGASFISTFIMADVAEGKTVVESIANTKKQNKSYQYHFNRWGKLHGLYQKWYPNGQKEEEGRIKNGNKSGKWCYWDENGKKIREQYYFMATLIRNKSLE